MQKLINITSLAVLLFFYISALVFTSSAQNIVFTEVVRSIELTSHLAVNNVFLRMTSSSSSSDGNSFIYAISESQHEHLSLFEAFDEKGAKLQIDGTATPKSTSAGPVYEYQIKLERPLSSSSTLVKILLIESRAMTPSPKKITQSQPQMVRYEGSHYFLTPYQVRTQNTQFKVPSRIDAFTDKQPTVHNGNSLRFGPYEEVGPYSVSPLSIRLENNLPFLNIRSLVKEYEVSHWGNLAVEETYNVEHIGAHLDGPFSRFDFMRSPSPSAVSILNFHVPKESADWYYRDDIGNISSSHIIKTTTHTKLQVLPRFVLFGGWRTDFYLGYNLPLQQYLSTYVSNSGKYLLNVTFGITLEEPYSIENHVVRVILPEGARDIQVKIPFAVDSQSNSDRHYTYLDTSGRPVVVISKKNTVLLHNQFIEITYSFSQLQMLKEPLLLTGAFFLLLLAVIVYVRIDLSIVPQAHRKVE
eukprot:TRINITY_DN8035_c0_g1_i1.p1 TRINITY_DN8035_c0_g1~~TRINITY_DN8035_c0_g1_i1.p1  ORF type:complete len:470 (-),score=124.47 TRINITY_DN8035_c0_g1_i1:108-1517(-)